jgi:hypothetical protein
VRLGSRRVRVRQSDLDHLLEAGSSRSVEETEAWAAARSSLAIVTAIRNGHSDDQGHCSRIAESMSGGVSAEVVGASVVIAARLLKIAADATGRDFRRSCCLRSIRGRSLPPSVEVGPPTKTTPPGQR